MITASWPTRQLHTARVEEESKIEQLTAYTRTSCTTHTHLYPIMN